MIPPSKKNGSKRPRKFIPKKRDVSIFSLDDDDQEDVQEEVRTNDSILSEELDKILSVIPESSDLSLSTTSQDRITAKEAEPAKTISKPNNQYELLEDNGGGDGDDQYGIPDLVAIFDKAIESDLNPAIFTEKTFPVAPNIIEWCRNPEFLGYSRDLFPRQVQVLTHFFGDLCYFCSDVEYVHNVPVRETLGNVLDRFTLLQYGVCPKCKRNRTEILTEWQRDPRFGDFSPLDASVRPVPCPPNEFVGIWGQRSGKSHLVSTFSWTYILHRFLSLPSPTRYFLQPNNTLFDATFVAPTLNQAEHNAWAPFRDMFSESPWFKEVKANFIDEGKRLGIRTFHSGSTFFAFLNKRLIVHMRAANAGNLRGATRIFTAIDELGFFNITEDGKRRAGIRDGRSVLEATSNSLMTVRSKADYRRESMGDYNAIDGYMFLISSPSSASDPIVTKAAEAPFSPRMYYTHYKTFEMNPLITEEFIRTQLAKDEASFLRNFCAIPPKAANPFFSDSKLLEQVSVSDEGTKLFKYNIEQTRLPGDMLTQLQPTPYEIKPDLYNARIMAVDNGEVSNSFALCIARYSPEIDGIRFEEFIEVAPYRGHVVDLAWCYDKLIVPLVGAYKFLHVCFDRWNSAYAVHDLRTKFGVDAQIYTLKWKDFEQYRDDLRSMKVQFPTPELDPDSLLSIKDSALRSSHPRAHFQLQLTTVSQFGNRLLKPDDDNDDLFRVSVLAHRFVTKFKDDYTKFVASVGRRRADFRSVGSFRGASIRGGGRTQEQGIQGTGRSVGFSAASHGLGRGMPKRMNSRTT